MQIVGGPREPGGKERATGLTPGRRADKDVYVELRPPLRPAIEALGKIDALQQQHVDTVRIKVRTNLVKSGHALGRG
jgi:hypothetical protein